VGNAKIVKMVIYYLGTVSIEDERTVRQW